MLEPTYDSAPEITPIIIEENSPTADEVNESQPETIDYFSSRMLVSAATKRNLQYVFPATDWNMLIEVADESLPGVGPGALGRENQDEALAMNIANLEVVDEVLDMAMLRQPYNSNPAKIISNDKLTNDAIDISQLSNYFFDFKIVVIDAKNNKELTKKERELNDELTKLFIWPQLMHDEDATNEDGLANYGYKAILSSANVTYKSSDIFVRQLDLDITLMHYSLLTNPVIKHLNSVGSQIKVSYGLSDKHDNSEWNNITKKLKWKNEPFVVKSFSINEDADGTIKLKVMLYPTIVSKMSDTKFWNFLDFNQYKSIIEKENPQGFWQLFNMSEYMYNRPLARLFLMMYLTGLYNAKQQNQTTTESKNSQIVYTIDRDFLVDLKKKSKYDAVKEKESKIQEPTGGGVGFDAADLVADFKSQLNKFILSKIASSPENMYEMCNENGAMIYVFLPANKLQDFISYAHESRRKKLFKGTKNPKVKDGIENQTAEPSTLYALVPQARDITKWEFYDNNNKYRHPNVDFIANFITFQKNHALLYELINSAKPVYKLGTKKELKDFTREWYDLAWNLVSGQWGEFFYQLIYIVVDLMDSGLVEAISTAFEMMGKKFKEGIGKLFKTLGDIQGFQNNTIQAVLDRYDQDYKVTDTWIKDRTDDALAMTPIMWINEACRAITNEMETVDVEPSTVTVPTITETKASTPKYFFKSIVAKDGSYNNIYLFTQKAYEEVLKHSENSRPTKILRFRIGNDSNVVGNISVQASLNVNAMYEVGNGINIRGLNVKNSILKFMFDKIKATGSGLVSDFTSQTTEEEFANFIRTKQDEERAKNQRESISDVKASKIWESIANNKLIYDKLFYEINAAYLKNPNMSENDVVMDLSEEQWINTIDFESQVSAWLGDMLKYEANFNTWGFVKLTPFMSFQIDEINMSLDKSDTTKTSAVVYAGTYLITELTEKFSSDGYITNIKGMKVIF